MSNTKPIVQDTRDGKTITIYPSPGGLQVKVDPKTDKYKK